MALKTMRKPVFWFKTVMWILSFVIAGFFIQFGAALISDLPTAGQPVAQSDFLDKNKMGLLENKLTDLSISQRELKRDQEDASQALSSAKLDYHEGKTSFDNWVQTRSSTEAETQNAEVIERSRALDQLKSVERALERKSEELEVAIVQNSREISDTKDLIAVMKSESNTPYQKALEFQKLKIFLMRLALTLPLLVISAALILKKRPSKYWPIYRGFVMFAFFAFFVELVPYTPSFGGYVRNGMGIIISLFAAYYMIGKMRAYLSRKQAEETMPERDRREKIHYEVAIKKITTGICPNCDRSFETRDQAPLDYCVHCKLCLFNNCETCGDRDNSFYKYCGVCGGDTFHSPNPNADIKAKKKL